MSLSILLVDELRGFYKSKIMVVLWFVLPVVSLMFSLLNEELGGGQGVPMTMLVAILVSSIAGTLGAVTLSTTITSELNKKVYDMFLIRPVQRWHVMVAKFISVYTCLILAVLASIVTGLVVDVVLATTIPAVLADQAIEALVISAAAMAVACSIGMVFGLVAGSVALSAILSVYVGNQVTAIVLIPVLLIEGVNSMLIAVPFGAIVASILLVASIVIFNKKQF